VIVARLSSASRGSITLNAELLERARARAESLGFRINSYIAVLIRNDLLQPVLTLAPDDGRVEKRPDLPLSIPQRLRTRGSKRAFDLGTSFSRYVEALIERDLVDSTAPLLVRPGRM
jgi:hypothetical protein